jgi:hypothetical protein
MAAPAPGSAPGVVREEYGREVSFAEAAEIANTLVGYFDTLAKIYHREEQRRS